MGRRHVRLRLHPLISHVFIPLLVGGFIYVSWRSTHLTMFRWFELLGIHGWIDALRESLSGIRAFIPDVVLYSLPDGTWVYSATCFFGYVWRGGPQKHYCIWICLAPALGIGGEIGQALRIVQGTFTWMDLFVCSISSLLAWAVCYSLRRTQNGKDELQTPFSLYHWAVCGDLVRGRFNRA